jgi:hypothetical protein
MNTMTNKVSHFGPIKSADLPEGWSGPRRLPRSDMGRRSWFTCDRSPEATINFFFRGIPVSEECGSKVLPLLQSVNGPESLKRLSEAEKELLREFLGSTSIGSNQITGSEKYNDDKTAVFEADSIKAISIANRDALFVRGRFNFTAKGEERSEFVGVLIPHGPNSREIFEVFLQAPGADMFAQCQGDFEATVQSLSLE